MSAQRVPAAYDEALTARRADLTALGACWREYMSHLSPRVAGSALLLAIAGRVLVGKWSWHDAVLPVVLLAAQPFVEWAIHKYLLHLPPFRFRGKTVELYGSIQHRNHHLTPSDLDRVLLKGIEVGSFLVQIALTIVVIAVAIAAVTGWSFVALALDGICFSYLGLFRYEWSHFLIHTPYVPKTRWYRTIHRNHRLHHFKHEGYWMGITSNLGDRVLGTDPDQRTISKSPTARTLGVE